MSEQQTPPTETAKEEVTKATAQEKPDASQPEQKPRRRWGRSLLLSFGPLVLVLAGGYLYATTGRYVSTENAYVKSEKIAISADVTGRVVAVGVAENQTVEAGQMLFRIDQRPYRIALRRAEAQLGIVANQIASYHTAHQRHLVKLEAARENLTYYQRQHQRQRKLSRGGIASQAAYDEAQHQLQLSHQAVDQIQQDIAHDLADLGGNPELPREEHPRYLQALAARDQAALDLENTTVTAPVAGIIGHVQLQPGEYVEAGDPVFSLVPSHSLWVTANLKETELTHVRTGQRATVRADAYPDELWQATISSISPMTGAEVSLLPPQNASGNWVKVVQRVPVRLTLDNHVGDPPLRAGMSVLVSIDTGRERPLPRLIQSVVAGIRGDATTASTSRRGSIDREAIGLAASE